MKNKDRDEIYNLLTKIKTIVIVIVVLTGINTIVLLTTNLNGNPSQNYKGEQGQPSIDYDLSAFEIVNAKDLVSKTKNKKVVVYVGRDSCGWCVEFAPVLTEATNLYKLKTLYIDIEEIFNNVGGFKDEKAYNAMIDLDAVSGFENYMEENLGVTPMLLVMENGKIVDAQTGYQELDGLKDFLEKNKLIK